MSHALISCLLVLGRLSGSHVVGIGIRIIIALNIVVRARIHEGTVRELHKLKTAGLCAHHVAHIDFVHRSTAYLCLAQQISISKIDVAKAVCEAVDCRVVMLMMDI